MMHRRYIMRIAKRKKEIMIPRLMKMVESEMKYEG